MFPSAFLISSLDVLHSYFKISFSKVVEKFPVEHVGYLVEVKVPFFENLNSLLFSMASLYCVQSETNRGANQFSRTKFSLSNVRWSPPLANPKEYSY